MKFKSINLYSTINGVLLQKLKEIIVLFWRIIIEVKSTGKSLQGSQRKLVKMPKKMPLTLAKQSARNYIQSVYWQFTKSNSNTARTDKIMKSILKYKYS